MAAAATDKALEAAIGVRLAGEQAEEELRRLTDTLIPWDNLPGRNLHAAFAAGAALRGGQERHDDQAERGQDEAGGGVLGLARAE
jgi:hypothetical protein